MTDFVTGEWDILIPLLGAGARADGDVVAVAAIGE